VDTLSSYARLCGLKQLKVLKVEHGSNVQPPGPPGIGMLVRNFEQIEQHIKDTTELTPK